MRGERLCRFHNDARARAEAEHDERIFAFSDELDAMTIPQLLETVHDKLANITSVVRTYPEAKLAVIVAVQRLAELTTEGFAITKAPRRAPDARHPRISRAINDAVASRTESTTTPQPQPAQ